MVAEKWRAVSKTPQEIGILSEAEKKRVFKRTIISYYSYVVFVTSNGDTNALGCPTISAAWSKVPKLLGPKDRPVGPSWKLTPSE